MFTCYISKLGLVKLIYAEIYNFFECFIDNSLDENYTTECTRCSVHISVWLAVCLRVCVCVFISLGH